MLSIDKVKVSVAMATYNGEKYLREQLDSLYSQTRVPDEIVVVDDRSTDKTKEILEEYHLKKGLRFFINERNLGVNQNFEKAIRSCTGDYIAICDQDDVWMPHKIETSLKKIMEIEDGKPACVSSQSYGVDKNLKIINRKHKIKEDTSGFKATVLQKGVCQGCSLMFNRHLVNILKDIPRDGIVYDYYIGLVAAATGHKYNIAEPLMYYRHHSNNVIAKDAKNPPLLHRIKEHLRMWKYSMIFDYPVYGYVYYVENKYRHLIPDSNFRLIDDLRSYQNKGIMFRMNFIFRESFFSLSQKIRFSLMMVLTSIIPLKNNLTQIKIID